MERHSEPERIRDAVREAYSGIAQRPDAEHPIPVGRTLAAALGYPPDLLDSLPAAAVEAFAGVAYIHGFAEITEHSRVLDVGCGAGMDSLIAARTAREVIGVDFSSAMLARATATAADARAENAVYLQSSAERIPLANDAFDVALVNGIFNLNPARAEIFAELSRVLRPGGRLFVAELVLADDAAGAGNSSDTDWFA